MAADVESELAVLGLAANRPRQTADKRRFLEHRGRDTGFGEHVGGAEPAGARAHDNRRSGLLRRRSVGCGAVRCRWAAVVWCIHDLERPSISSGEAAEQYRRAEMADASAAVSGLSTDSVYEA